MTRKEYLLTCLAEECMEVAQRATKALRFGLNEVQPGQELNNQDRLLGEIADFFATLKVLIKDGHITMPAKMMMDLEAKKLVKIEKFYQYAMSQGTIQPESEKKPELISSCCRTNNWIVTDKQMNGLDVLCCDCDQYTYTISPND